MPGTVIHPVYGFAFLGFSYLRSTEVLERVILLIYRQKVSSRLTLYHNACVFHLRSPHHTAILSSGIITGRRVTTVYHGILRQRDHIRITFIPAYCYNCSIALLVIVLISYWTSFRHYTVSQVCRQGKTWYIWGLVLSTISGIRCGAWNASPTCKGGFLCVVSAQ